MRWRTASEECASAPAAPGIAAVKKYFISKVPRLVPIALFEVTRETVDSCMPISSATVFRLSGRRCDDAMPEEAVLLAHDLARHLEDGLGTLFEAAGEPVGGLQAIGEEGLVGVAAAPL